MFIFVSRYSLTSLKIGFLIILRDMLAKTCFGMASSSCYACHRSNQISLSVTLFLLGTLIRPLHLKSISNKLTTAIFLYD